MSAPLTLQQLLKTMIEKRASDLHVTVGCAPQLRIDGTLLPLKVPALGPAETKALCYTVLSEEQKATFESRHELDLSFGIRGLSRFRANIYQQRGEVAGAFRAIPLNVPTLEELGLPAAVGDLASRPRGLVLVTGPTGSGKSSTLAAVIDKVNTERRLHIVTIEDPIEYLHPHKLSLVNQREVGRDTANFKDALKYVLRQDPDVVLVGEMRDLETIEVALTLAETGHLVFGTLHTLSAIQSINRIIDVFPANQQAQVRAQLSFVLQAVVTQLLIPRVNGPGRCLAVELLIPTAAVRNLIREDKLHQMYSLMQVGREQHGMITLNQSLFALYSRGLISIEEALGRSSEPDELKSMIAGRRQP